MTPKKTSSFLLSTPRIAGRFALIGVLGLTVANARDADRVIVSAPVIVSMDGGGPAWDTIPELIAAAEDGDALACFQYAQLLEVGDQVEQDESKAFVFYQKAAFLNYPDAVFRVGKAYHDGLMGQPVNYTGAFEYYERAAYLSVPEASYNVGAMLVSGRGGKRDYVEGLAWLLLAAEHGTDPGSVDQVKARLKRYPDRIARAEKRLPEIKAEIANGHVPRDARKAPPPTLLPPAAPTMTPAPSIKPSIAPPTLPSFGPGSTAPSIGVPKISIPKPNPPPAEPEEETPPAS